MTKYQYFLTIAIMLLASQLYIDPNPEPESLREGLVVGYVNPHIDRAGSEHELLVVTNVEKFQTQWGVALNMFSGEQAFRPDEELSVFGVERVRMHRFEPEEFETWRSTLRTIRDLASTTKNERV